MILKYLLLILMVGVGYIILFMPIFLIWMLVNRLVFKRFFKKIKQKRIISLASLILLLSIQCACLLYINAHPFVVYNNESVSDELVKKVFTFVHDNPDKFHVENFAGVNISNVTIKLKEEIIHLNGNDDLIGYKIISIPFGENHWTFKIAGTKLILLG